MMVKKIVKVLYVIDSLGSGGAQRQLVELAKRLDRTKYLAHVVIYYPFWHFKGELDAASIPVTCVEKKSRYDLMVIFRLAAFIRSYKPDIIHSFLHTPGVYARISGKIALVPRIITSQRNIDLNYSRSRIYLEKLLHRFADHLIVNAEAIKSLVEDEVPAWCGRLTVIHNGVDIDHYRLFSEVSRKKIRCKLGCHDETVLIGTVGNIKKQKNPLLLLEAFAKRSVTDMDTRLVFVGFHYDQQLVDELVRRRRTYGLEDKIYFFGETDDVVGMLSAFDIFVLPSLWEGCPNALLEAMATGLPVVASDVADNRIIIADDTCGRLFPNNDRVALTKAIDEMLEMTEDERGKMGKKAQLRMEENFSMNQLVESTTAIYEMLM